MGRDIAITYDAMELDAPMVVRLVDPRPRFKQGGLAKKAQQVRNAGAPDDDVLLHLTPEEFKELKGAWGEPTYNERTGLPEYSFLKRLVKKVGSTAKRIIKNPLVQTLAPIAANVFLPGVGGLIAGSLLGATSAKANGQNPILGGLMGLGGSFAGRAAGTALKGAGGLKGALGKITGASGENPGDLMGGLDSQMNSPLGKIGRFFMNDEGKPAWGKIAGAGVGGLALLGSMGGGGSDGGGGGAPSMPEGWNTPAAPQVMNRTRNAPPADLTQYGKGPGAQQHRFFSDPTYSPGMADGGRTATTGTGGRTDDIEALLSEGEYVMDAETVALLGNGSTEAGSQKLDELRANLRQHKGSALAKGEFSPDAKDPMEYLGHAKGGKIKVTHSMREWLDRYDPKSEHAAQIELMRARESQRGMRKPGEGSDPYNSRPVRHAKGGVAIAKVSDDLLRLKKLMTDTPEQRTARYAAMSDAELEEQRQWMRRAKDRSEPEVAGYTGRERRSSFEPRRKLPTREAKGGRISKFKVIDGENPSRDFESRLRQLQALQRMVNATKESKEVEKPRPIRKAIGGKVAALQSNLTKIKGTDSKNPLKELTAFANKLEADLDSKQPVILDPALAGGTV